MTHAADNRSTSTPSRWNLAAVHTAAALVLLAVVVPFLRAHEYNLLLPESLILIGGAAAIGLAIGAITRLRPALIGPPLLALTLTAFALYHPEVPGALIRTSKAIAPFPGSIVAVLGILLAAIFLSIFVVCVLLRQHIHTIVAAIFGTILVSAILLPTGRGGEAKIAGALPADLKDLPPVVHIILDEHIGPAGLPPELPESAVAEDAIRTTFQDFALYRRAYSRFPETHLSLASLMNKEREKQFPTLLETRKIGYALHGNAWFDQLKAKGYAVQVYQSEWLEMCDGIGSVDACYTYPLYSVNAVQRTSLSTEARLRVLLEKLHFSEGAPLPSALPSTEAFERFQSDILRTPRGVAYIVQLLLPHYGYLYRDDCSLADPAEWENQPSRPKAVNTADERLNAYRLYLPQLVCTERRIALLFDALKRAGIYDEATIIVHGDHGSRIGQHAIRAPPETLSERDLLDHFSTLLAIKAPGIAPGVHEEPVLLQRAFADNFLGGSENADGRPGEVLIWVESKDDFAARDLVWPAQVADPPSATSDLRRQDPRSPATDQGVGHETFDASWTLRTATHLE